MIRVSSARFFLVVAPCPSWMRVAFGAAVLMGGATLWFNPSDVDSALGSILLLQMFSASSGYAASAARGHFDAILVSDRSRVSVAAGSLAAAALPGAIAWMMVVAWATALGAGPTALAPQRQAAFLVVSCVAWSAGLAWPPMAAGALWITVLVTLALSRHSITDYLAVVQSAPHSVSQFLAATTACVVCPFLLLGDFAGARDLRVISLVVTAAAAAAAAGGRYIGTRDYTLVEPA